MVKEKRKRKSLTIKLDRRLYLNAARTRIVEEGDRDAAFLYGLPNEIVNRVIVEALGYKPLPPRNDGSGVKKGPELENKKRDDGLNKAHMQRILIPMAKGLGVVFTPHMTKVDLVAAIRAAREVAAETQKK